LRIESFIRYYITEENYKPVQIKIYQVDAFTEEVFKGNPGAVCPLPEWLPDGTLQAIAMENNLSETSFFVPREGYFEIRWFTPSMEVDLCGHGTLASGYMIFNCLHYPSPSIILQSKSGELIVTHSGDLISLNFPTSRLEKVSTPELLVKALGIIPVEVYKSRDGLVVLKDEGQVRDIIPDFKLLKELDWFCTIITSEGTDCDFVSRVFAPQAGIDEDPVTGSAHCTLIPYWSERLGKKSLKAKQLSRRSGVIYCEYLGERVKISGHCAPFLEGEISIKN
jgi:PhzF family phenazine biosynthesis protein